VLVLRPTSCAVHRLLYRWLSFFSLNYLSNFWGALHFFIEYDTGKQGQKVIATKLNAYQLYLQSEKCKSRNRTNLIRVLFVTRSAKHRLENVRKAAREMRFAAYFWLADEASIHSDFFCDSVWSHGKEDACQALI
jgi:hypothetical protein